MPVENDSGKKTASTKNTARRIAISAFLIALGVVLSVFPGSFPIGPSRVFPFQHMINGISGVLLGPIFGGFVAIAIGILRIGLGTGTVFSLSGGVPGAIVVGLFYHYVWKRHSAALLEPIGTALGALLSAYIVAPSIGTTPFLPFLGITAQWALFLIFFLMASIPGAMLGYIVLKILKRSGLIDRLQI